MCFTIRGEKKYKMDEEAGKSSMSRTQDPSQFNTGPTDAYNGGRGDCVSRSDSFITEEFIQ